MTATLRIISIVALVSVSLAAGIAGALHLVRSRVLEATQISGHGNGRGNLQVAHPFEQVTEPSNLRSRNSNRILELPTASENFVGYWGGYVHSTIQRFDPGLIGTSPERVSVVFGRHEHTVFMTSELYGSANQTFVSGPRARMAGARVAIVEYQAEDHELYYIFSHRFQLNAKTISYQSRTNVFDCVSHRILGIVVGRAILKPLLTTQDQLRFAHPSQVEIPRTEISASSGLVPP
jgi:hypothetical protein